MSEEELVELLPIVAELTHKYTYGESTSVTYEKANQLMGAVLYCIKEYENYGKDTHDIVISTSLKDKYFIGKKLVTQKMMYAKDLYNRWIKNFDSYDNQNYYETVVNAIAGFFIYYDAEFEPQNNIITCDYPTLISVLDAGDTGIDLIYRYLNFVKIEQDFLSKIPRENVIDILERYDRNYKKQYYNIVSVILRHILGCILIEKSILKPALDMDYIHMYDIVSKISESELEIIFRKQLSDFIERFYEGNKKMYEYLSCDIPDFVIRLKNVRNDIFIRNVVIL